MGVKLKKNADGIQTPLDNTDAHSSVVLSQEEANQEVAML